MTDIATVQITALINREGGPDAVTDDPSDHGGLTRAGITQATATAAGLGDVRTLTHEQVFNFYLDREWVAPGFDRVAIVSERLAGKLFDIRVNGGNGVTFMQRALNVLNRQGSDFADIAADGAMGPGTLAALAAFLKLRGNDGERVLVFMVASLEEARYIELAERDPSQEKYEFGWALNRALLGV